ncbi:MAG: bacterioferritin [Gammaproteobacteria bacterium]|nr:bacterioferritin [Gammaproteobacteria bacterium]
MKGDQEVIAQLNACLGNELIAINQYFLHARMFQNWGLDALNKHEYKKSIIDMKDADKLIERILFLEGLPNVQKLGHLSIGENTEEMLSCDLSLQSKLMLQLKTAIAYCESIKDFVSRDLLSDILENEETHTDWIETQQLLIKNIGIENYMQSMIHA